MKGNEGKYHVLLTTQQSMRVKVGTSEIFGNTICGKLIQAKIK